MADKTKFIAYGFIIFGYIIGFLLGLKIINDPSNYTYQRVCVSFEGNINRTSNNDGNCVEYDIKKSRENLLVPIIIHGGAGAFIGGWIGLLIVMPIESYENRKRKSKT